MIALTLTELTPLVRPAVGPAVGALGILVGAIAHRRAGRAVRECTDLINGSVGSRGTVDPRALRDLAVVRYDALSEMSGQLSFSIALLNALGDGVVISSINASPDNSVTVRKRSPAPAA